MGIGIAWGIALWAGFASALVLRVLAAFGAHRRSPYLRFRYVLGPVLGLHPESYRARIASRVAFFVCTLLVFPAVYAFAFEALGRADASTGLSLAVVHALLTVAFISLVLRRARRNRSVGVGDPGVLASHWGVGPILVWLLAHLLYGGLFGYFYAVASQ